MQIAHWAASVAGVASSRSLILARLSRDFPSAAMVSHCYDSFASDSWFAANVSQGTWDSLLGCVYRSSCFGVLCHPSCRPIHNSLEYLRSLTSKLRPTATRTIWAAILCSLIRWIGPESAEQGPRSERRLVNGTSAPWLSGSTRQSDILNSGSRESMFQSIAPPDLCPTCIATRFQY